MISYVVFLDYASAIWGCSASRQGPCATGSAFGAQVERASITRHSRGMFFFHRLLLWLHFAAPLDLLTVCFAAGVSQLKKIHENLGNLSMVFDFDGTLVAAGAGLARRMSSLVNVLGCGVGINTSQAPHQCKSCILWDLLKGKSRPQP